MSEKVFEYFEKIASEEDIRGQIGSHVILAVEKAQKKEFAKAQLHFDLARAFFAKFMEQEINKCRPTKRAPDARKSAPKKVSSNKKGSAKPARG